MYLDLFILQLRTLQQKEMNNIRTLRDDYRNAYKTFSQTLEDYKLLNAPDWFQPGQVPAPAKSAWIKSTKKLSYSQKFQISKGTSENKTSLQVALKGLARKKREKSADSES